MAGYLLKWCWDQKVSPTEKLVLFALNEHCNPAHGDWRCFPSHSTLAKLTGMSRSSLIRSIQSLEKAGLIRVARQYDGQGRQQQNMYWLSAPFIGTGEGVNATQGGVQVTPPGVSNWNGGRVSNRHTNPLREEPLRRNTEEAPVPANGEDAPAPSSKVSKTRPEIPFMEIVGAYHELLPALPRIVALTDKRKSAMRARWVDGMPSLDVWRAYFAAVSSSDFLCGRIPGKSWRADIDFLLKPETPVRVEEGRYHAAV